MSIEDKIREASNTTVVYGHCLSCPIRHLCRETESFTGMNFCENTADMIIKEIERED